MFYYYPFLLTIHCHFYPRHGSRLDKNAEAILVLQRACKYDPRNSMLSFQLAHVLLKNGSEQHLEEALRALYVVKEYAPKESPVYSTLGEVTASRPSLYPVSGLEAWRLYACIVCIY
jgi:hypothetical protein